MAAFQFPAHPDDLDTVVNPITGSTYQWRADLSKWVLTRPPETTGSDLIWEGDSPPDPIGDYKLWYSTDTLELYFYYCDAAGTCAWLPTSTPITTIEDLNTAVAQLQAENTTEFVELARGSRVGSPPADFDACVTQHDWNWTAEEDLTIVQSGLLQADSRLDALEQVTGKTLLYDCESTSGAAPSGSGKFTVNNSDASLVTIIQLGPLDKNGELPQTPLDGDTLLFVDKAGTGIEHRYSIDDASGGLSNMVVSSTLDSGDSWLPGVEYETYLFPTNKEAVEVSNTAPLAPDIGAIWIDSVTLIWYAWDGADWIPAHLPPSFDNRISQIEADVATNTADIAAITTGTSNTGITEAEGDARYLQLTGGTVTGPLSAEKRLVVNAPRDPSAATNSFILKGNLGGVENQSLLYDFRTTAGNAQDSRVIYKGPVADDDEITTKKYVDDEIATLSAIGSSGNPALKLTGVTGGSSWYKLINLQSNNTYQAIVKVGNGSLEGSTPLTVCVDGTPTRNSIIELGASSGTGSYEFRISQTLTLDVKPLDSGTMNISITILGDANNSAANDVVTTEQVSTIESWVETGDINDNRAGGVFSTADEVLNYNNKIQLANVADPTDGTMVGNRDYNDARYLNGTGVGGSWGSSYDPITFTDALVDIVNYRKISAIQVFGGSHTDPPGWGATYSSSSTKINFTNQLDASSLHWEEGTGTSRTTFSVTRAELLASPSQYLRGSDHYIMVNNSSIDSNKVAANLPVFWNFEFYRGTSCGFGCGWTANVHCEYINKQGRLQLCRGLFSCNTQNMSNMRDLSIWGQSGYATWGRWGIAVNY